jgi:excisionase family DNA binding protein
MRHEHLGREVLRPRQKNHRRQPDEAEPEIQRKRSGPRKARTAEPLTHYHHASERRSDGSRHTTNPPVPCLGRNFLADKVRKGRRVARAPATAPSGGRFWHGSAVRTSSRRGREGSDLRSPGKDLGSYPVQSGPWLDREYMRSKAPGPAFFTERTLAAYLAVSDRTIRNWIRRGELPSYKLGASRRIDPSDVEDFLARHRDAAA